MRSQASAPERPNKAQLNLRVDDETRRLLEIAASHEGRSMASVVDDAIKLYFRSHSEGYRAYLEVARRFLEAPDGSDERALAGAELSAGLARGRGGATHGGGDAHAVRARIRQRQSQRGDAY